MKSKNFYRIVLVALVLAIGITGCQKDDTTDPGTTSLERDKFLGTWKVISNSSVFGSQNWQMTINASSSSTDGILIKDFDQKPSTTTTGSVSGNSFYIPQQIVSGDTIAGSGSYNNGSLSFSYTVRDGQTVENVTATATK